MEHARHAREFMGMPPSGKQIITVEMQIERVVDGQIVDHWRKSDNLGLMQQLGALTAAPAS